MLTANTYHTTMFVLIFLRVIASFMNDNRNPNVQQHVVIDASYDHKRTKASKSEKEKMHKTIVKQGNLMFEANIETEHNSAKTCKDTYYYKQTSGNMYGTST